MADAQQNLVQNLDEQQQQQQQLMQMQMYQQQRTALLAQQFVFKNDNLY